MEGTDRDTAIQMWKGCGFFPTIAIKVLMHKSLLKISEDDKLEMHDLLRDMGRQIVQEECPSNPGKRSRLSIMGKYSHLPKKLKWLEWHGCPLGSLPYDFNLMDLKVLDLSRSNINELQSKRTAPNVRSLIGYYIECSILSAYRLLTGKHNHGMHTFKTLKVLNLCGCNHFVTSPDLSNLLSLIKLTFDDSLNLMEVHDSIGNLRSLVYFSMRGCKSLEALPNSFVQLNSLKVLILSGCSKLSTLPEQLGCMQSLIEVALDETAIRMIPNSIGHLTRLSRLSLVYCDSLVSLPDSIGELCSLTELMLDNSAVHGIPGSVGSLKKLKRLGASNCSNLASIPDSFGSVENLEMLRITDCKSLEDVPGLETLTSLMCLHLVGCTNLSSNFKKRIVKETFQHLESLSIPGNKCPSWFKHQQLCCEVQKPSVGKHEIKGLLLWVVFSMIKRPFRCTFHLYSNFSLVVNGEDGSSTNFEVEVPVSYYRDSNMLFYHYRDGHPLIRLLKEGGSINILITEQFSLDDFQIVKGGIHAIYRPTEGQEDIASEEEALLPEKLAQFFMSS
ncbi:Disease resistance protein [Nymphaea thermarum]|nr:Disease resistance protein [Nymphaea thermarum]